MRNCIILLIVYLVCAVMLSQVEKEGPLDNYSVNDTMVENFQKNQRIMNTKGGIETSTVSLE